MKDSYLSSFPVVSLMLFFSYGAFATEAPYLSPISDKTAIVGEQFILDIDAMNADPAETYELMDARPGMVINPTTGVISWIPADPDDGGIVTVRAYNSEGESIRSFLVFLTDQIVCANELISYWKLDETSGDTYADFKGGYTATSLSPLMDVEGLVDRGKQFSPAGITDQFVNVSDNAQYDFERSGGFSVSLWFKYHGQHTPSNINQVLIARGSNSHSVAEMLMLLYIDVSIDPTAPKITFVLRPKTTEPEHYVTPVDTIDTDEWYHVVAVYDGPPNPTDPANLNVYINNIKHSYSHVFGTADFTADNNFNLNIGYWDKYPTNRYSFNGDMDEILIYDKALSDSEISGIYNDGLDGKVHCGTGNAYPLITSTPIVSATQDIEYSYTLTAKDYDGDAITLSEETLPDWLSFNPGTGLVSGTPDSEDVGDHSVILHATDGDAVADQKFTITVANVNDPPVVTDIPNQIVAEGTPFTQITLDNYVADADDPDNTLTWTATGQSNLNVNITNRVATITPNDPEWNGSETITFTAEDPLGLQGSDAVGFQVTAVNDYPVVADIPNQTIAEGQSFNQINLDQFVSDADHADSTLTWTAIGQSDIIVSIVNRIAIFTVDPDWNGSEIIIFLVEDPLGGQDSDTTVLSITGVNDAPVVAGIPDQVIAEGLISKLEIKLDDFVADVDDPDSLITWTVAGYKNVTVDVVNQVATLTPDDPEWNGSDTLIFTATDTSGAADMDTSIFTVLPVNDPPTLNNEIPDTIAEIGKSFLFVLDPNTFKDVDQGDSLVYTASIVVGGSPIGWITFNPATRTFSGTPADSDNGKLEVIVTVKDDSLKSVSDTFSIKVISFVGIDNPLAELEINLYPNPNNGRFIIESNILEFKDVVLEIFNEKGQLVWNRKIKDEIGILHEPVDLGNLPDGWYLLKLRTNSSVINKRFIIAY